MQDIDSREIKTGEFVIVANGNSDVCGSCTSTWSWEFHKVQLRVIKLFRRVQIQALAISQSLKVTAQFFIARIFSLELCSVKRINTTISTSSPQGCSSPLYYGANTKPGISFESNSKSTAQDDNCSNKSRSSMFSFSIFSRSISPKVWDASNSPAEPASKNVGTLSDNLPSARS